jgi:hypothetical protein
VRKVGFSDVMRAGESSHRPFLLRLNDPRINGSRLLLPSIFIILIHYIWFSALAFCGASNAYQRGYPHDQNISVNRFLRLISSESCLVPITVVFVRFADAFRYILLFTTGRSPISENPFHQCYQRLGFGLPDWLISSESCLVDHSLLRPPRRRFPAGSSSFVPAAL